MDKARGDTVNAKEFIAEWQKRYRTTLPHIDENMLQIMEEYAGQMRERAGHPDIEQILERVASHEITPAKAMELLQNWSDRATRAGAEHNAKTSPANRTEKMPVSPISGE